MTHELWVDTRARCYGHGSEGDGGGWPGLRQVVLLRTTRQLLDHPGAPPVVEAHFYLASLGPGHKGGSPRALLKTARGHWEVENGLHFVKDACLGEDASRNGRASLMMAWARNLAVFLLRFVAGATHWERQCRIRARPSIATRLLGLKRRPQSLLGEL